MKKIFCFVVLNYKNYQETINCVHSILDNAEKKFITRIIVVDNNSNNGSKEALYNEFNDYEMVDIIVNNKNLGFAKGHNTGFVFAKKNYNPDYIFLCNNDLVFKQKNFETIIDNEYKESGFAVLGPMIYSDNEVFKFNREMPKLQNIKRSRLINLKKYLQTLFYLPVKKKEYTFNDKNIDYSKKAYDVVLHGSLLVFSRKYIELFDGLYDKTFLYCEEYFLFLRLKQNNLKSVYCPDFIVEHYRKGATKQSKKSKRKVDLMIYRNTIKSQGLLLREMKNNK